MLYAPATISSAPGDTTTSHRPYAIIFPDTGKDSKVHIFKVRVDNSDVKPVPVQIGNLALSSGSLLCHSQFAQTDMTDPETTFALLNLAGPDGTCGNSDDVNVIINYKDDSSMAPVPLTPRDYYFSTIYDQTHQLQGIVQNDAANHKIVFYQDKSFTNPVTLITGTNYYSSMMWSSPFLWDDYPPAGYDFLVTNNTNNTQSVWRVTSAGVALKTYDGQVPTVPLTNYFMKISAESSDSVFAVDQPANYNIGTVNLIQQPRVGGPPLTLYSFPLPQAQIGSFGAQTSIRNLQIIGSSLYYLVDKLGAGNSSLESVPIGEVSTSSVTIKQYAEHIFYLTYNYPAGDNRNGLFAINLDNYDPTQLNPIHSVSSEVFKPDGTAVLSKTPDSASFAAFDGSTQLLFQIRNITAVDGGYGGGTLNLVDAMGGTAIPFHLSNGDIFKVPSGQIMFVGLYSSGVGIGSLHDVGAGGDGKLVLLDLKTHLAVPF